MHMRTAQKITGKKIKRKVIPKLINAALSIRSVQEYNDCCPQ